MIILFFIHLSHFFISEFPTSLKRVVSETCGELYSKKYSACKLVGRSELIEEADVVLEEVTDVVHSVAEHGNALNTHAEGVATVLVGVDTVVLQNGGVHHAATQDL